MALQSSGQISINDIKTELGNSSGSLNTLSVAAGKAAPHAMSEFYGYANYSNLKYYENDGTGDYISGSTGSAPFTINSTQDLSISMWVRPQNTADQNHLMINFSNTTSNGNNRLFISYTANVNRIITRVRTNSSNFDRQFALHDNSTQTGLTTTTAWSANNRGNANSDGWINLTVTYDASQSSAEAAFKLYWNGSECTSTAASSNGSRGSIAATNYKIGENIHSTNSGGNAFMDFDEIKVYDRIISSEAITNIYNSGVIADSSQTSSTNLVTEWTFEGSDAADSNSRYTSSITGGTIQNH
jgi:hypothetical protein